MKRVEAAAFGSQRFEDTPADLFTKIVDGRRGVIGDAEEVPYALSGQKLAHGDVRLPFRKGGSDEYELQLVLEERPHEMLSIRVHREEQAIRVQLAIHLRRESLDFASLLSR
jgi:hypothetical protein